MSNTILGYEPAIQDHPLYEDVDVDFEVGDVVELLAYTGTRTVREDGENVGQVKTIGSTIETDDGDLRHYSYDFDTREKNYFDPTDFESYPEKITNDLVASYHVVREIDGFRVKVAWGGHDDKTQWIPRSRIVGTDLRQKAKFEYKEEKQRRYREKVRQRKQTDMDTLLEEVVVPHARQVVADVWNDTIDLGKIDFFWNPQLTNAAGKAYWGRAVPSTMADGRYAIGLAPDYYYQHGIDALLEIVRHELIHQWQYLHPAGDGGGHGPKFRQWVDDCDTHRHCKHWSKDTEFSIKD